MLRTRIRTGVLIRGAAVALLLAGCDSGGGTASTGNPDVPSIPQSVTTTTTPTTSATAPPATPQPQQPAPAADGGECKVADLDLRLSEAEGTAGTTYRSLVFTNKGARTCTIQGFPGVSYVAGDDGHQVGPAAFRTGEKGPVITLKPGDSAFADIGFVQVQNYDPATCQPTEVRGLRIYPPHDYDSAFVPNPGTGCAGSPPGNQLTVATVQAGAGA
ncbi:DUF4232 domain-containing protein [Actinophytocola sp.]|uniref:DUF4232 domain-containing protein n=1 Tax=Actinophytocola sp. TaxID=1872138 RepID=UPI002ED102CE